MTDKITFYHGTPVGGLKVLTAKKPENFDKEKRVYLTSLYPMALIYGVKNFEYTYGYTKDGEIYLDEYFEGAFEKLYAKKSAYVYVCAPKKVEKGKIPNEFLSNDDVEIVKEIFVPDLLKALEEEQVKGTIKLYRYKDLSDKKLAWIEKTFLDIIARNDLLSQDTPYARYIKENYFNIWQKAQNTQKSGL